MTWNPIPRWTRNSGSGAAGIKGKHRHHEKGLLKTTMKKGPESPKQGEQKCSNCDAAEGCLPEASFGGERAEPLDSAVKAESLLLL